MKKMMVHVLMFALSCLFCIGQDVTLEVSRPLCHYGIPEADLDSLWVELEKGAMRISYSAKSFKCLGKASTRGGVGTENALSAPDARLIQSGDAFDNLPPMVILASKANLVYNGTYVLDVTLLDARNYAVVSGPFRSRRFSMVHEIYGQLPTLAGRATECLKNAPAMEGKDKAVAVLYPVVIDPQCLRNVSFMLHDALCKWLAERKVRTLRMVEVERMLRYNDIDTNQSLSPAMYSKVAAALGVKQLLLAQITGCSLTVRNVTARGYQRLDSQKPNGAIAGVVQAVGANGAKMAFCPFEIPFDFGWLASTGKIDTRGWREDDYYSFMLNAVMEQVEGELEKAFPSKR